MQTEKPEKNLKRLDSIQTDIDEKYSQYVFFRNECGKNASAAVIAMFECGQLLSKVKKVVGYGNWLNWLSKNTKVSWDTANRFIRFAESAERRNLPDYENCYQALMAFGIRPEKEKKVIAIGTHDVDIYSEFTARVTKPAQRITVLFSDYDVKAIPIEHKEKIKEELKPIVEFYQGL